MCFNYCSFMDLTTKERSSNMDLWIFKENAIAFFQWFQGWLINDRPVTLEFP